MKDVNSYETYVKARYEIWFNLSTCFCRFLLPHDQLLPSRSTPSLKYWIKWSLENKHHWYMKPRFLQSEIESMNSDVEKQENSRIEVKGNTQVKVNYNLVLFKQIRVKPKIFYSSTKLKKNLFIQGWEIKNKKKLFFCHLHY